MNRLTSIALLLAVAAPAVAQTSSIGRNFTRQQSEETKREDPPAPGNPVLEKSSIIAVKVDPPRRYKVNDYLTVIVREQRIFEADGTANARRQADLQSELDAFIRFTNGGVGAAQFVRGKPNIDYRATFNQRNDAESEREDRFTTRITARIIDVKPNGNLIFEATKEIVHDDEKSVMTLTGGCRSADVTPDNTVLSTEVADLAVSVKNTGGVRDATRRGWIGNIYDWIRPL